MTGWGLAGNIDATNLQQAAARIEAVLNDGEGDLAGVLRELETQLNLILNELQQQAGASLPATGLADPFAGEPTPAVELLAELRERLEDDDVDAATADARP